MVDGFFKNTYVVGDGRKNYLNIGYLEDPLFTSFTFDIDFVTSPLFYTINNYLEVKDQETEDSTLASKIDRALKTMYGKHINAECGDYGYDILPVMSANFLESGYKLGFGLQQNVYMDRPLYGATEYIYMVDKRNAGFNQNDVRYSSDNNGNTNLNNSYKIGDSVKEFVSESDKAYASNKKSNNDKIIEESNNIMSKEDVIAQHEANKKELQKWIDEIDGTKAAVYLESEGYKAVALNESEILNRIAELNTFRDSLGFLKQKIVDWVNDTITSYRDRAFNIYNKNQCMKRIESYADEINGDTKYKYADKLEREFTGDFRQIYLVHGIDSYEVKMRELYNEFITNAGSLKGSTRAWTGSKNDDGESFLINSTAGDDLFTVREKKVKERFENEFKSLKFKNELCKVNVSLGNEIPYWATIFEDEVCYFYGSGLDVDSLGRNYDTDSTEGMIEELMSLKCEIDTAFEYDDSNSSTIRDLERLEQALSEIRYELYGQFGDDSKYNVHNPDPISPYGKYLKAKEVLENDEFSQALKQQQLAQASNEEIDSQLQGSERYADNNESNESNDNIVPTNTPMFQDDVISSSLDEAPQTVFDMLGFISGMREVITKYPYIIQGITGLDAAYNNHYGIKDPYMGAGEDKITLTCLESLDLRVSSMFNRYFNAIYDRQYIRERVPVNLRRFNCSVYVHDVRSFVTNGVRAGENRISELTDMYYSVIEFKFYDCEIVPEETGNIFNDISNEAPSEMKKTNFTFRYGNCVVNFVPNIKQKSQA